MAYLMIFGTKEEAGQTV